MNIIIPCAGSAKRFKECGYKDIKPFIVTKNKLMIEWVLSNLFNKNYNQNFIFLFQKTHIENYDVKNILKNICHNIGIINYSIIEIDGLTQGCAKTVLYAKNLINNDDEVILANSDQFVDNFNIRNLIEYCRNLNLDCGILTFSAIDSKWSFVKRKENSIFIEKIKEKEPISSIANVGIFYWKNGKNLVWSLEEMINKNILIGGEFYIAPSIQELIDKNYKVSNYHLNDAQKNWGLGVPYDLLNFIYNYKNYENN